MKVILKGLHQSPGGADLCAVVAAVTEALQLGGFGGWWWWKGREVGGLKAQHGSIWATGIIALNQLKVLAFRRYCCGNV